MKKKTLVPLLVLSLAASLLSGCGFNTPGTSEKVGSIVRVSKQGVFHETWEAQIIRGGMNSGSGSFGQAFEFTIENYPDVETAKRCMVSGEEVRIEYRTEGVYSALRSSSGGHFLTLIEAVKK